MTRRTGVPADFAFYLANRFTLLPFVSAVDMLRVANVLARETLYRWTVVGDRAGPVMASNGLEFTPEKSIYELGSCDVLFVCGGADLHAYEDDRLCGLLRLMAYRGVRLGALCTGSFLLARARLLDGYRCTVHHHTLASLRERFPQLVVSRDIFVIDRDRYTCAGGITARDLMLSIMARDHGEDFAREVADESVDGSIRKAGEPQRVNSRLGVGADQPKLFEAIALMEANVDDPLSTDEIAALVGVSRRQVERLFKKSLATNPSRFYIGVRLEHARKLIHQTTYSVTEIALMTGFASASHFSKCYKEMFGLSPRFDRETAG